MAEERPYSAGGVPMTTESSSIDCGANSASMYIWFPSTWTSTWLPYTPPQSIKALLPPEEPGTHMRGSKAQPARLLLFMGFSIMTRGKSELIVAPSVLTTGAAPVTVTSARSAPTWSVTSTRFFVWGSIRTPAVADL